MRKDWVGAVAVSGLICLAMLACKPETVPDGAHPDPRVQVERGVAFASGASFDDQRHELRARFHLREFPPARADSLESLRGTYSFVRSVDLSWPGASRDRVPPHPSYFEIHVDDEGAAHVVGFVERGTARSLADEVGYTAGPFTLYSDGWTSASEVARIPIRKLSFAREHHELTTGDGRSITSVDVVFYTYGAPYIWDGVDLPYVD